MVYRKVKRLLVVGVLMAVLAGCSPTTTTSDTQNPGASARIKAIKATQAQKHGS